MSDSGTDCRESELGMVLDNYISTSSELCDDLSSIAIDDGLPRCGSATRRQRCSSTSSPCGKRANKRRRSRSLQLDNSSGTQLEKKPTQKKFVSMAEAVHNFQRSTPKRFHTQPIIDGSQRSQMGRVNPPYMKLRCTIPQSPRFTSHLRARPVTYPSKEEREAAELQEMQQYAFKAAPLKAEILKEPQIPKKVEPRPVTKLSPFRLTEVKKLVDTEKQSNKSRTAHTKRNIFPAEKQEVECAEARPVWEETVTGTLVDKELEQPGVKKPTPMKRVTKPEPFTFEERDKIRQQQKEEKIRQFLEEERKAREFHANPIPKSVKFPSSFSGVKSPTQPQPFHLYSEERSKLHEEALKAKLEEERRAAEAMRFKARPPVVLKKKPFEPVKPHRVLQEITDLCLNTEIRSKEREKFEMKLKEKEMYLELCRRQFKEEEERKEEEELARMRKEAVHKAQPIPKYAPIVIAKCSKDLTNPQSPFSRTKPNKSSD